VSFVVASTAGCDIADVSVDAVALVVELLAGMPRLDDDIIDGIGVVTIGVVLLFEDTR
jgi:hypothetical protein